MLSLIRDLLRRALVGAWVQNTAQINIFWHRFEKGGEFLISDLLAVAPEQGDAGRRHVPACGRG